MINEKVLPVSRHGLLLFDKKPGFTSFESLGIVKKAFSTKKVGHTGTLDKFASGLLLLLIGRGVKMAPLFADCAKEYVGTICFGAETDTLDPEGEIIAKGNAPSLKEIEAVLDSFRGEILQIPPAYSAIHIQGRRAHELIREGKQPEMKKRPVTIHELEILSWTPPQAVIKTRVSAGTYIRSLARDIALAAGSRAYLSALKRNGVGPFRLEDAVSASREGSSTAETSAITAGLRPLDTNVFKALGLPCFFIDRKAEEGFFHGKPLETILTAEELRFSSARAAGIFRKDASDETASSEALGFIHRPRDKWVYGHVFTIN